MNKKLKNELLKKMMIYFEYDNNHINHTYRVLYYADELSKSLLTKKLLKDINLDVVVFSAILHDIGIPICKKKYNSIEGQLQEIEGPPIAREILESFSIDEEIIKEVCNIVGSHHSVGEIETTNFKIIWDADWLVNLPDVYDIKDKKNLSEIIDNTFLTETGLAKAKFLYL
ncbi:MAG: HD domain-containing protein [Actinobacteria bacterium]|nr:HD domain-containing protein [Cyanobacteriota bacterium]MCL5771305.1 HD domain-containing protein [Actinomycetota bacterium]